MKRRSIHTPEADFECLRKIKMTKETEDEIIVGRFSHETKNHDDQNTLDKSNPLLNEVILRKVLNFLPVPTLKICRQVCRRWNECGTPRMLHQGVIILNAENLEDLTAIESWMNSIPYSQQNESTDPSNNNDYRLRSNFHNFTCDRITHCSYPNIWKLLGKHVQTLVISHYWGNNNDLTLQDYEDILLTRCPNLERIVMPSTAMFKSAKAFLLCATREDNNIRLNLRCLEVTGKFRPDMRFFRIFTISPHLTTVRFECALIAEFWNPAPYFSSSQDFFSRLSYVKNWELCKYANDSLSALTSFYFTNSSWSLETVAFEIYKMNETDILKSMEHIRKTLKSMRIRFFNKQYDSWVASDRNKPWVISSALSQMETFQVSCDDLCEGPIFSKALAYAILLPKLQSLTLTMYEQENENEQVHHNNLMEWDEGQFLRIYKDILPILKKKPEEEVQDDGESSSSKSESNICQVLQRTLDEQEVEDGAEEESNSEEEFESDEQLSEDEFIYEYDDDECSTAPLTTTNDQFNLSNDKANDPISNAHKKTLIDYNELEWIRRDCLKQLTLPSKMCDISSIVPIIKIFPNIRELKLDIPSHHFLQGILTHWTKLERLEVSLESKPEIDWNIILTRKQSSIANLQHLHYLKILMVPSRKTADDDCDSTCKKDCLNDLFIYEGLLKLEYLQRVSIIGQNFSEMAVTSLREKCLPFCYLDFKN